MKAAIHRLVPRRIRQVIWNLQRKRTQQATYLQTSTAAEFIGERGPLIENIFEPLQGVPGWFNIDDCAHFHLILSLQSRLRIKGNLLEIGSYFGRSTAVMVRYLAPGERIVICDAFALDTEDWYQEKPSPQRLMETISRVNNPVDESRIQIHQCLSSDLVLDNAEMFRFIHIDGGHSAEQAYSDLSLSKRHLLPDGVIVMDDYHNPMWPGVTAGTDRFLRENRDISILADLNRHGAMGRKLYLMRKP